MLHYFNVVLMNYVLVNDHWVTFANNLNITLLNYTTFMINSYTLLNLEQIHTYYLLCINLIMLRICLLKIKMLNYRNGVLIHYFLLFDLLGYFYLEFKFYFIEM